MVGAPPLACGRHCALWPLAARLWGGDTDGTTLPADVGMDRGIAKKAANFVGRRSLLLLPAATDPELLQLVGLMPLDRSTPLPVGAHIATQRPPSTIEGYVTSSAASPVLGHPIALVLLWRGRERLGTGG